MLGFSLDSDFTRNLSGACKVEPNLLYLQTIFPVLNEKRSVCERARIFPPPSTSTHVKHNRFSQAIAFNLRIKHNSSAQCRSTQILYFCVFARKPQ